MKKQKQKTARRSATPQPDTQEVEDQRNTDLAEETDAVLDEIACCLAEVEQEDGLAEKKVAKAAWDENSRQVRAGLIDYDTYWFNRNAWILKYSSMFEMTDCCGTSTPDFGDLE